MLFALVVDSFLRKMEREINVLGRSTIRACADNVGATVEFIIALGVYKSTGDDFTAKLAGLMSNRRSVS